MTPPMIIPKQKPVKPAPLMAPSCWPVNPKSAPQLARMPPRMPKPTPAARMAMNPANNSLFAFGAIATLLTSVLLIGFGGMGFSLGLYRKSRQFDNLAAFKRRLVGAKAHTGPIGGLFGIGESVAILKQGAEEFMDQVRMRSPMTSPLGKAQVRFLREIVNTFC